MYSLLVAKGPKTRAANPGSTSGRLPKTCPKSRQAALSLPQIRAGCPEPWGRQICVQFALWQAAQIWDRFWAGLPKVLPGVLPGFPRSCLAQGRGKELVVADIIYNLHKPSCCLTCRLSCCDGERCWRGAERCLNYRY